MNQLGYYGKTPHRGDFVRFNLPQTFLNVWDDWLQQVMLLGEQQHDEWADMYLTAPVWNFVLSSGIAGSVPWIGTMKPSIDKVGRRFPFCLAMSIADDELPCSSVSSYAPWFEEARLLLDRVLHHDYQFNDLKSELATLLVNQQNIGTSVKHPLVTSGEPSKDAITIFVDSNIAISPAPALSLLVDTVLMQTIGEYSLWISNTGNGSTIITEGLPVSSTALSLFNTNRANKNATDFHANTIASESESQHKAKQTGNRDDKLPTADDTIRPRLKSSEDDTKNAATVKVPPTDDLTYPKDYSNTSDDFSHVPLPKVEPLVLDDDDLPDAPWEK